MDFVNKLTGSEKNKPVHTQGNQQAPSSSSGGGFMDKLHGMAGGGPHSEKNEDALDKGVDWAQENVFKQGSQTNESALEQAKDEKISDTIRDQYKKAMGKDFPVADK
ncbi:hypothetical protein B0T16DRAFT_389589 [Cercophora newfieldiana]|uniref:Uncharacterized protein n=1 Tax=Cercophora newfieldiana TaxID=92897 RepID=A0AA39YBG3_9PEZI|nr:hypothetical protein B0T16DRAFT_389589 [Cercophora newfieldiana]